MSKLFNVASLLGFLFSINASSALANPTVEAAGFVFKFQKCSVSKASAPLKCDFLVKNTGERRSLSIYSTKSRAYDTGFNDIAGNSASLGGREYKSTYTTEIPEETTLKGSITFGKAPEGELTSLDLGCYVTGKGSFKVKLPLSSQ